MTVIVFPQASKNIEIQQQQWEEKYSVSDRPALPENKKTRGIIYSFAFSLLISAHSSHTKTIPCQKKSAPLFFHPQISFFKTLNPVIPF